MHIYDLQTGEWMSSFHAALGDCSFHLNPPPPPGYYVIFNIKKLSKVTIGSRKIVSKIMKLRVNKEKKLAKS